MEYVDAAKKVKAMKPRENFLVVQINYDKKVVLPYKEGIAFMSALANAEQLKEPYKEPPSITGVDPECFRSWVLSGSDYEDYKIAALLQVPLETVKEYAKQAA